MLKGRSVPPRTTMLPLGSGRTVSTVQETSAPIRRSTSRKPIRPGLSPTSATCKVAPGRQAARTTKKAAADTSPGTRKCMGLRRLAATSAQPGPNCTFPPQACSMRSVWSRVGWSSSTLVTPRAKSPASKMADFTCAEATSGRHSFPCKGLP